MDSELTHFNADGRPRMVDVSEKDVTLREAIAGGSVRMNVETFKLIRDGGMKKGDVLGTAQVAGITGAKKTSELVPMCHNIFLTGADIKFDFQEPDTILIRASVRTKGETGVEMEALTAVSTAALTIYDMCKAVDRGMEIKDIRLLEKSGGRSGLWKRDE